MIYDTTVNNILYYILLTLYHLLYPLFITEQLLIIYQASGWQAIPIHRFKTGSPATITSRLLDYHGSKRGYLWIITNFNNLQD